MSTKLIALNLIVLPVCCRPCFYSQSLSVFHISMRGRRVLYASSTAQGGSRRATNTQRNVNSEKLASFDYFFFFKINNPNDYMLELSVIDFFIFFSVSDYKNIIFPKRHIYFKLHHVWTNTQNIVSV